MKRYQKIILGLVALSTVSIADGRFEMHHCHNFSEECVVPSFSLNVPSGLVGGSGGGYIGISGMTDKDDTDGGIGFGVGYGDPDKIGGAVSLSIGSIDPSDGGSFNRGAINVSAGHDFRDQLFGIAVGIDDVNIWHDNDNDHSPSPTMYIAATKLVPNEVAPMVFTVGAGNNNFAKVNETGDKKDKVYPFVSGAVYIFPELSLIADYSSKITSVGVGIVPFCHLPLSMTLEAYDIGKERAEDKVSFVGSLCLSFNF